MKGKNNYKKILVQCAGIIIAITAFMFGSKVLLENPIILASFASSIFVIFAMPEKRTSNPKVVFSSQLIAACVGYGFTFLFPEASIFGGALAVGVVSILMVVFNVRHAPAAATALSFSFKFAGLSSFRTFLVVLLMVGFLAITKGAWHLLLHALKKLEQEFIDAEKWLKSTEQTRKS